jgi:hypothetical protein
VTASWVLTKQPNSPSGQSYHVSPLVYLGLSDLHSGCYSGLYAGFEYDLSGSSIQYNGPSSPSPHPSSSPLTLRDLVMFSPPNGGVNAPSFSTGDTVSVTIAVSNSSAAATITNLSTGKALVYPYGSACAPSRSNFDVAWIVSMGDGEDQSAMPFSNITFTNAGVTFANGSVVSISASQQVDDLIDGSEKVVSATSFNPDGSVTVSYIG